MKNQLLLMIRHDAWANQRVAHAMANLAWIPSKAHDIFDHIIAAHAAWYSRVTQTHSAIPLWRSQLEVKDYTSLIEEFKMKWEMILENEANDVSRIITYQNSSGHSFSNTLHEIVMHLCMHSQYHRGQVVTLIRDLTETPPATDLILYLRESNFSA
jgi:uncharacterized damage-inducible protein DinB